MLVSKCRWQLEPSPLCRLPPPHSSAGCCRVLSVTGSLPLNMRYFFSDVMVVNSVFALTFLTVRCVEQMPLAIDMWAASAPPVAAGRSPWSCAATGCVVAAWCLLQALNARWSWKVVRGAAASLTGTKQAKARHAGRKTA